MGEPADLIGPTDRAVVLVPRGLHAAGAAGAAVQPCVRLCNTFERGEY